MADVFISYAREDRPRVARLSEALEADGFSVWWDRQIVGGAEFSRDIERELDAAGAVIVAWSKAAVESRWVRDEAEIAAEAGKLVALTLDGTRAPLGFRQFQVVDCAGADAAAFAEVKRALQAKLTGAPLPPATAPVPPGPLLTPSWRRRRMLPLAAAATVVAMLVGVFVLGPVTQDTTAPGATESTLASNSVQPARAASVGLAVLPFASFSSDPEQEFFADGLTEEILNWLGNVEGLRVPGRTSSFQFKGKAEDLRGIGQALNVAYVLEGSVRRSGDRLRITAQLIDTKSGDHLWSEAYDRTLDDIFDIQTEIARTVVTELLGKIPETGIDNPAAVGDVDPRAHELYLEGRALWSGRAPGAFDKFRAAVAIDPRHAFAQAYVAVIAAHSVANGGALSGVDDPASAIDNALAEAVRLKPDAAEVLFAKAWVAEMRSGLPPGSPITDRSIIDAYEAAVRANPRHVEALHALTRAEPSPEKVIALYERILEIDPGHGPARTNYINAAMRMGDRARAERLIRQGLVVAPDNRSGWAVNAKVLGDLALFGETVFGDRAAFDRDDYLRSIAASFLADLGAVQEARFLALKEAASGDPVWSAYFRVAVATLDGDADAELAAAQAYYTGGEYRHFSTWMLANAMIRTGDYERAYVLIAQQRPEVGAAAFNESFRIWNELADMDFVTAAHALDLAGRREDARALWKAIAPTGPLPKTGMGWMEFLYLALLASRAGDTTEAVAAFQSAYDAGFRYLVSYACGDCIYDGFAAEHGLFAPLVAIPENRALLEKIKAENVATLEEFNRRYGILDRVHAMMAAEGEEVRP